jgi:hypothetical protein
VSEPTNHDRLQRVEREVETLLSDVREQVQRLRSTVDRMRALRGAAGAEPEHTFPYGGGAPSYRAGQQRATTPGGTRFGDPA